MDDALRPQFMADRLLRWLRAGDEHSVAVATPVDALAQRLGLTVASFHPDTQPPGTLGYLEPGEDLIFLRAGLSAPIRRFTLAHEIGHAVLHRASGAPAEIARSLGAAPGGAGAPPAQPCDADDLATPLETLDDEVLHPGQAYSARSQRETEANAFAAALLLPAERLLADYRAAPAWPAGQVPKDATARAVAARFGVSEDVVLRRLAALLLSAREELEQLSAPAPSERGDIQASGARLDAAQRVAAESEPPALVIAGPGTGKTSTLVHRVAYLIRRQGVPADAILALTFSNKAAREMRARVTALIDQGGAAAPEPPALPTIGLPTIGLPTISTIHAFCGDLLRRHAHLAGLRPDFRLVSEVEGYFLLRRLTADLSLNHYQPLAAPAQYFPDLLAAISRAKDELVEPEEYARLAQGMAASATTLEEREAAERALEVADVYAAYQRALAERGDPDFGDVIALVVRLLQRHDEVRAELRARYHHILVDEFQDINRAMGVLLRTLAGADGPLWAVGDADQAIYRFRGASPANLARFAEEYPSARIHRLRRNYRSISPILEAAAAFAGAFLGRGTDGEESSEERSALEAARPTPDAPRVTLATAPDDAAELAGLCAALQRRIAGGVPPADQAVLCRTRRQARRVVAALAAGGIPGHFVAPLLEQDEIKDVLAVAALLAQPSGGGLLRAGALDAHRFTRREAMAVLREARARGVAPLGLFARDAAGVPGVSPEGAAGLKRLAEVVDELRRAPDVATGLARYLFSLTSLGGGLLAAMAAGDDAAPARARQLGRLLSLAQGFEDQRRGAEIVGRAGASGASGAAWAEFLVYVRALVVLRQGVAEADDARASEATPGVAVLTVHASKGLEFPVVYLPGLAARRFPLQRRHDAAPPPPGLAAAPEVPDAADAQLTEEACLFYVAMTRARDELVLSAAERYGKVASHLSPFLAPIERRLGPALARERWTTPAPAVASPAAPALPLELPPTEDGDIPPSAGAVELYQRCPRQYAYRYVYGLRPRDAGLLALRQCLAATARDLQEHAQHADMAEGDAARQFPSRAEARALFERHWAAQERGAEPAEERAAWGALYHRHGLRMLDRAWDELARGHAAHGTGEDAEDASAVLFDQEVRVQAGGREVRVTLDRVERAGADSTSGAENTRYIRHRMGRIADRPDTRALLYALAAEQSAGADPERAEIGQVQLATGERRRVELSARQKDRLRADLERALAGMEGGEYPPRPDPHMCATCPFLLICPA